MYVGVCKFSLMIADNTSLKGKRQVIQRIRDRVQNNFNVSISEVDDLENHKRVTMGISTVGSEYASLESILNKILNFINGLNLGLLLDETILVEKFEGAGNYDKFIDEKSGVEDE